MLGTVSSSIFTDSSSVGLIPIVSAEWNQNLFNHPYITVAGDGVKMSISSPTGTVTNVTSGAKTNFSTKSFTMSGGTGKVSYTFTGNNSSAYKIITYIKTNNDIPVMISTYASGSGSQYGSSAIEASSVGWTKVITYIGGSSELDSISSFTYTIVANDLSGSDTNAVVMFTVPEAYETTYFDYRNSSLWPTESPFTNLRPGESYVLPGTTKYPTPTNYRKILSPTISGYTDPAYSPISSIVQNPTFYVVPSPVPVLKNILPTSISQYKYFVSSTASQVITARYEKPIMTNKIVIKLNTIMTTPTVKLTIDGTDVTVDGSTSIVVPTNPDGLLVLYWTGGTWTKTKWTTTPTFNSVGALPIHTTLSRISLTQISQTPKTKFSSYSSNSVADDLERMQVIEISPRLEIDLSDFVQNVSIEKALDSKSSNLPISSTNSNTASITLSGIPAMNGSSIVPIFSSQSDNSSTILASMLRKGIKFYVGFYLDNYSMLPSTNIGSVDTYIPGGVFYSDSWSEDDISSVSVQCFDISRYLQSVPAPDYVANLKSVFDIVTNMLDMAGFTDYDYDSLYSVCNNKAAPMDIFYYYNNSNDTTLIDAINKIFLPYQIAAYIDEYGIMKFKGLHSILSDSSTHVSISDNMISQGGLSISNNAKPGKISIRYQPPKIKQSASLQNITNDSVGTSSSYVYTTSADVVWQQQSQDTIGFNYLDADMDKDSTIFQTNINDVQDIFHSWSLSSNGYVAIENEIVSFLYKEFKLSKVDNSDPVYVSVKNDLELQAEVNKYIKEYGVGMRDSAGSITNAVGNGTTITYTSTNSLRAGDKVSITGIIPYTYNITGTVTSASSSSFTVASAVTGSYVSGGGFTASFATGVKQTPTGKITNVKRGLFGTPILDHNIITDLNSKGLTASFLETAGDAESVTAIANDHNDDSSLPSISKIRIIENNDSYTTLIYPTSETDNDYQTYSVKFDMPTQDCLAAGLFFNMSDINDGVNGTAYYVELSRTVRVSSGREQYLITLWTGDHEVLAWSDVTALYNNIVNNFPKIIKKNKVAGKYEYSYVSDKPLQLKVVHNISDGSDGENANELSNKSVISVFLNNSEVTAWQIPGDSYDPDTNPIANNWKNSTLNLLTGKSQKPVVDPLQTYATKFGFFTSTNPSIPLMTPQMTIFASTQSLLASLREIYATKKPLIERSVSYFFQDRKFLDGIVQDQPLHSTSPSYMMQTNPEISGINVYDVQYTTPAAVSVSVWPIQYMWTYLPGTDIEDGSFYQKKLIDEYSLSYSTILNTGYRAKFAIANNSPNMVFLHTEATDTNKFAIDLYLYTNEVIAPSDQEIVEQIIDQSNASEVVQMDAEWIQSKEAAQKTMKLIEKGLEGFSKNVSLSIFGNPLIQVGDIVNLSYSLNGISNQRYVVHSVSHSFDQGLSTSLVLNRIQE